MKSIIFYLLFILLYESALFGQTANKSSINKTVNFEKLSIIDGLSSNSITCVIQDSKGFLWIGTDDGINKYDGYEFTTYKHDQNNINSISDNYILTIYEDRSGILWIGCNNGGLNKFDQTKENFVTYLYHPSDSTSLGSNRVYCIYEDNNREIWIGTWGGGLNKLNRKNGNFIRYKNNPNDSSSLSSDYVSSIWEDDSDNMWIGTWGGGLNKFDRGRDRFQRYPINTNDKYSPSSSLISLYKVISGDLWMRTWGGGINKFNIQTGIFEHFKHDSFNFNSISADKVTSICEENEEVLWVGTDIGGLNKFDIKYGTFIHYRHNPLNPNSLSSDRISCVFIDRSGIVWVGTRDAGLNKLSRYKVAFEHYKNIPGSDKSLSNDNVLALCEDQKGDLWIGTLGGGLNRYDKATQSFFYYKNNRTDPNSLSHNVVNSIHEDRSGTLWIGTRGGGLSRYDKIKDSFQHYKNEKYNNNSLSNNNISSIFEDKRGILWIGTWGGGLNKFNRVTKTFSRFIKGAKNYHFLFNIFQSLYETNKSLAFILKPGNSVNLTQDFELKKEEKVLIFSIGEGIRNSEMWDYGWIEDQYGEVIWKMKYEKSMYAGGAICNRMQISIDTLKSGKYKLRFISNDEHSYGKWIALGPPDHPEFWGVQIFSISNNEILNNKNNFDKFLDAESISDNYIRSIYEDKSGKLWISTRYGGINEFDPIKGSFKVYLHDPKNVNSISDNHVFSIEEDNYGYLWFGTARGLNKLKRRPAPEINEIFMHFSEKNGLPSNRILGILSDDNGYLWISTNKGLSKFDPDPKAPPDFINYDVRFGLQNYIFNGGACFKSNDGRMYFGGIGGFNSFYPPSILNENIPEIVLSDFKVFNMPVAIGSDDSPLNKHITYCDTIQLSYDKNVLSFEFAALDYDNPLKNKYAYKMEGLDKNWIRTDAKKRFVTYTNLDPGKYIFSVKGSNSNGIWNEVGTSVVIMITPPWWAMWWSYTLYFIIFISIVYALRRYDLKRISYKRNLEIKTLEAKKYQEIDNMKSSFFTNISHEFRTPLTLILGPSSKIIENTSETFTKRQAESIKKNAKKLLHLINQLLDLSKLDSGKLRLRASKKDIVDLAKKIVLQFESHAVSSGKKLIFSGSNHPIEVYIDEEKFEKIINNLLSNALKFTNEGDEINFKVDEADTKSVEITLKDTGIGISRKLLPKLFERFYQVAHENGIGNIGTGVGLTLTKELVELHGGTITVDSEIGKWTEFKITFPLGRIHLKNEEVIESGKDQKVETVDLIDRDIISENFNDYRVIEENYENKTIILIIEDNLEVRQYIKESIEKEYYVVEALDGEEGLNKAEEIIPDLIITDLMMPKMDGNEVSIKLKNDSKTSHIPIIILTTKSEQENKIEGLRGGADDYLTKPFDTDELLARINNLIEIRRKLQEKYRYAEYVPDAAKEKQISSLDEDFMHRVMQVIDEHISEEQFNINKFGKEVGLSRMQLHRKLKALTGKSAGHHVRTIRLNRAHRMIKEKKGNISEVSYSVGFGSPAYFTKCFKEEFGYPPSKLMN